MKNSKLKFALSVLKKVGLPSLAVIVALAVFLNAAKLVEPIFSPLVAISSAVSMPGASFKLYKKLLNAPVKTEIKEVYVESSRISSETENKNAAVEETQVPVDDGKKLGDIKEQTFAPSSNSKTIMFDGAAFSNTTKYSNDEILKILKQSPKIDLSKKGPKVLIYHTHTTESYEQYDRGYFTDKSTSRTTDETQNMVRVGDEIVKELEKAGIEVVHDRNVYDYPSYNGAYYRSADSVRDYLKKYPSIEITLDIHRDAIGTDKQRIKPTVTVDGKKAAQMMIIAGADDGTMDFKNWRENMKFASKIQTTAQKKYPLIMRSAMVCHRRYNMYLTENSLLIEVGGHANTLDEAIYSGELLGKILCDVIKEKV